jgi:hypothetical protein
MSVFALNDVVRDDSGAHRPAPDTPILRSRILRSGSDPRFGPKYADPIWPLADAHADAHIQVNALHWSRYPARNAEAFKPFFLATLDHPLPQLTTSEQQLDLLSVSTISLMFRNLRPFAEWMDQRGLTAPCQVTTADLTTYYQHVLTLERTAPRKAALLRAVQTLWLFRAHLPADCRLPEQEPWGGASAMSLADAPAPGRINKTPRIAPDTMEALLAWCLRVIEEIGPDIRDAWSEYRQLNAGTHPSQADYPGRTLGQRLTILLESSRQTGVALPGTGRNGTVELNAMHVMRLLGKGGRSKGQSLAPFYARQVAASGVAIAPGTYIGEVTRLVDGRPWREGPIPLSELSGLVAILYAACFTALCYLSGMRPGEVLNLRRGCRGVDPATGELTVSGRAGKGHDRHPSADDAHERRPWTVVEPVHTAISMLESLGDQTLLFAADTLRASPSRAPESSARASRALNDDIDRLITWVNTTFAHADGSVPIPADPTKHIHATRFRRTLAYFIVRRPRGLIAAALQYGHLATKVTVSYAGDSDTSWMDDLAIERLEYVLEQIDEDWTAVEAEEHVSGPSAAEYRSRVARAAPFAGRVVNKVRSVERLLTQADPEIHHGEGMTCVWRAETAACRKAKIEMGLPPADAPDEAECRSNCQNLAYTDRDIDHLRSRLTSLEGRARDPLSPRPRRDRAVEQAERVRAVIERHDRTRPLGREKQERTS